jgi:glycosyltransferase involved in cell wall biosynthesis
VAGARAARRAAVPYVISPRGMLVPELIQRKSGVIKRAWLRVMERRGFTNAAAIHFTSQLEWDDARRVGIPLPAPVVVPNGVDLPPRPSVPRDDRTLVFLGRITWKKGLDRVIEALPRFPDVRLVIAGNDEEQLTPALIGVAERVGAADRVEFRGPVYGAAKDELLARATLFVLLSTNENFGNAVLEALAMETPVVLSEGVGLAGEVVDAGAGVIGLDEVPALLDDGARRARMGARGRALVESRFSWPAVAKQMEEAYCSITSRR